MNRTLQFEVTFADVKPVNPLFSTCKIFVCYAGENRNGSVIPKEVIEDAIPTLYNIPIVGRYSEDIEDFVDHGGKIEITGNGANKEIKYVHTTKPYGVVPESASIDWETVGDKEYLTIEGALLWTGRYPEAQKIIDDGKPQSMEIDVIEGRLRRDKKFQVEEMNFSALCILGDDVEPAFEDAQIVAFSLDKDAFQKEFSAMMQELKFSMAEGGNEQVDKESKLEFALTSEQLENELKLVLASQKSTDDWGWEYNRYGFVDYMPEEGKVIAIDWQNGYLVGFDFTVSGDLVEINFDSGERYKVNYVPMDVNGKPDGDEAVDNAVDGDEFSLAIKEHFTSMREFAKAKAEEMAKKPEDFEKEPEGEEPEEPVDGEGESEPESTEEKPEAPVEDDKPVENPEVPEGEDTPAPTSAEFAELAKNFTELKEAHDAMVAELESLRAFKAEAEAAKRAEAEKALFERFSAHLSEEEIAQIREKASEFTLDELETQLFVLVGKKSTTFSAKPQAKAEKTANRIPVFQEEPYKGSDKSYASLIARFGN